MFGRFGTTELLIILGLLILIFGARKLPELGRALGSSVRELKKGLKEGDGEGQPTGEAPANKEQGNEQQKPGA